MDIQIIGLPKSKPTRAAQRFFSERRLRFHDLDLRRHDLKPGELRKWVERFGVEACLDADSAPYRERGLQYVSASAEDWMKRMADDPRIIALPLVRCGTQLSVGDDPEGWQQIADSAKAG